MSEKIKFHLDENVSNVVDEGLRRREIDVSTTPEQGLISATDEEQLAFCISQKRVIFTQDTDFLKIHNSGERHAGIVYCNKGTRSIGDMIRSLVLIWELLEPEDMQKHLEFI